MENNALAGFNNLDLLSAIQNMIRNACIIDFGTVRKVVAKGIVDVELSVASTEKDIVCLTCVLANVSSKVISVDIEPSEGDKVIVFYPRKYDDQMFSSDKTVINPDVKGYNLTAGIAFLFNQFKTDLHKNFIRFNADGTTEINMQDADENVILNLSVGTEGITLTDVNKNTVSTTDKGIKVTDCNNNDVSMTSEGITITDANGCKIVSSSEGVVINNKLKVKAQ